VEWSDNEGVFLKFRFRGDQEIDDVRGNVLRTDRTDVFQDSVVQEEIGETKWLKDTYLQLRAVALISLLRISGKPRAEVAVITLENFSTNQEYLEIKFILEKKRAKTKRALSPLFCGARSY
jgi:site-specific recombinase XerD